MAGNTGSEKAEALANAVEVDRTDPDTTDTQPSGMALKRLLGDYYRFVAAEDVLDRQPVDLLGAVRHHWETADERVPGQAVVSVFTPTVAENGWSAAGRTVIEIVVDDMPFLVDSAMLGVERQGLQVRLMIHPQLPMRRDPDGKLLGQGDPDSDSDSVIAESWMHIEVDRLPERTQQAALAAELERTLADVRHAVDDWPQMRAQALSIAHDLATSEAQQLPVPAEEIDNTRELLEWLAMNHFTFLGYREYELSEDGDSGALVALPGTGLGILREDPEDPRSPLPPEVLARAREKKLLIFTKANSRSTVHRNAYLDYIAVKTFNDDGIPVRERRFLGLLASSAYTTSIIDIPLLRRKTLALFDALGFEPNSHNGNALLAVLETFPRDELLQADVSELIPVVSEVLHLAERRQVRMFIRRDEYHRFLSCLLYLPRDRYTTKVRQAVISILKQTLKADSVDYFVNVTDSVLARIQFVVRVPQGQRLPRFDAEDLERRVIEATHDWSDDFTAAATSQLDDATAARLSRSYAGAFPEAYKEDFAARVAVTDALLLDGLSDDDPVGTSLYQPLAAGEHERRFKLYTTGEPVSLSRVLPLLSNMGVEVTDERPYSIRPDGRPGAHIYDFGLRIPANVHPGADSREFFDDAFRATWDGLAEPDGFNGLVMAAGLTWRQVVILRAYQRYLTQARSPFSQGYIERTLLAHPSIARGLIDLFEARFDPALGAADDPDRDKQSDALRRQILSELDTVSSLDEDRILRSFLGLIEATLRTNYYQPSSSGSGQFKTYLALKLDPGQIRGLPEPRPAFEIFVYAPEVEGVHLRFGQVARGGLRWSDRQEDFRTEVLGLVKAQMVKNTVIVPVGAKGGFYAKQLPDSSNREAFQAAGIEAYKTFIRGLLDVTDNIVGGELTPPADVVRYDPDDPYMVVAADKGTATFSDIANSVSAEYGFWLGDAFASGGSVGYDHKGMGITAKGAWESVKRHFREIGVDCQTQDFTCVGIGDMSGDVFGNGMMLSEHTRLVAAFDHRDIFLDPDPDPAASFAERKRLFAVPRSSWADYDAALISPGGGVFSRTRKSVPISEQVRSVLGLADEVQELSPQELMHAILCAPVDLFWNGGIGTYVKGAAESHADVGDKANDPIRVDGKDLRCRIVGEGGNLGFTQLGRIEYARNGGAINTDFIDNSAGVDTSDHEVNIKILLDQVVASGDLTVKQRNELLGQMTGEVEALVLKDNYRQNIAMANAGAQAASMAHVHRDLISTWERTGKINRALEFLPGDEEMSHRIDGGTGLAAPELAVMLSYTKIDLAQSLTDSDLPDDPFLVSKLESYFPTEIAGRFDEAMRSHRLRREIIISQVVNEFVNSSGVTAAFRLQAETASSLEDVLRANLVASRIFDQPELGNLNAALDNQVDAAVQTRMRLEVRTLVERTTRWLVMHTRPPMDMAEQIEFYRDGIATVVAALPDLVKGHELALYEQRLSELVDGGVPADYAARISALPPAYAALGMVHTAHRTGLDVLEIARVHFELGEQLQLGWLLERIVALPRRDRWQTMARAALRDDLHGVHAELTAQVLARTDADASVAERVAHWLELESVVVDRAVATVTEILEDGHPDLARLSVGLRVVRGLLR